MTFSNKLASDQHAGSMVPEFYTSQIRYVEHMSFLEVISFFGEGVGAALYLLGIISNEIVVQMLGVFFVAIAVVALVAHLGARAHLAWRALAKIRTSWVSRGSLFITLFMAFSVTSIFTHVIESFVGFELTGLGKGLSYLAALAAPLVIIYAGMMLRSMKAVTLWRTLYLPTGFSIHSIASALLVFLLYSNLRGLDISGLTWLMPATFMSLIFAAFITFCHLYAIQRSAGVKVSMERLLVGKFRGRIIFGVGVAGILIPLGYLLIIFLYEVRLSEILITAFLLLSTVSRLYGDYAYRSAFVMSGAYEPVIPPSSRA